MTTTRRTHIVRCPMDDNKDGTGNSIDIEVLDAIGFRGPDGKEMILNVPAKDCVPFIVDDTGGGHSKRPAEPTRRSHMKRIKTGGHQLDIEVLEVIGFRDENGEEWILDMHATNGDPSVFDSTDGTGDNTATRRVHTEKIYNPFGKKGNDFLTIERCDAMAFRTIMGQEVIIDCKSSDDQGSTTNRADTTVWSPTGYDPSKDDPKPPVNSDPHNYVKAVKGATDFLTGTEKISMGPLWWIRKINIGGGYILITFEYTVSANAPALPKEPTATLTKMPFNLSKTYNVLGDIYQQITEGGETVKIENPVSGAMGGLYQWSYTDYVEKKNTAGFANVLWLVGGALPITDDNAFDIYPVGTDQCGNPVAIGNILASFWNCNGQAVGEAVKNGFTQTNRYVNRGSWDNQADAQYSADALNSLEFFKEGSIKAFATSINLTPSAGTNTVTNRAVMGFNLGALKSKLTDPKATTLRFEIDVSAIPNGKMVVKGAAFAKIKDFPLDSKNVPSVSGFPQDELTRTLGNAGTITVTVDFSDKDNPIVSFDTDITDGGASAG